MIQKIKFSECVKYMIKGPFGSDMKKSLYVPKGDNTYKVYIQGNAIQQDGTLGEYYVTEEYFHKKLERFEVHPGDYIITCDGTLGKYLKLGDNIERGVISSSLLLLKLDEDKIYDKYFELLWEYSMLGYLASQARNACLIHLPSAKAIGEVEIELPPMDVQIDIANKAYAIKNICYNRVEEICMLDELIKARFVEMFGEGLKDDGKFEVRLISEIGKVVSGATPKTAVEEYWDGANLWITPAELSDESFILYDSERKITDRGVKSCAVNLLPIGTVILSSRAPIGKVAIAGTDMYCNQGFKNIIPNDMINSIYLYELLKMETAYLNSLGRGATFKEISKQIVENIRIKVPPIELQEQFAEFVKQVDKSKVVKLTT